MLLHISGMTVCMVVSKEPPDVRKEKDEVLSSMGIRARSGFSGVTWAGHVRNALFPFSALIFNVTWTRSSRFWSNGFRPP